MILQVGDDGVVSSVDEEELVYVDKNELEEFIEQYRELEKENEQLKQFKDNTFVLINEMIETANLYRTPIKSIGYGNDLGYWNGVYQKLKELKEILEKGDVE